MFSKRNLEFLSWHEESFISCSCFYRFPSHNSHQMGLLTYLMMYSDKRCWVCMIGGWNTWIGIQCLLENEWLKLSNQCCTHVFSEFLHDVLLSFVCLVWGNQNVLMLRGGGSWFQLCHLVCLNYGVEFAVALLVTRNFLCYNRNLFPLYLHENFAWISSKLAALLRDV